MKFHETHFEEYINAVKRFDMHPEMAELVNIFPQKLSQFGNLIVYGPSGVGKYSQILRLLKKYSPSHLKYDKQMTMQNEKQQYIYRISDIHYEIDMALLGCNSKIVWHEVFTQIVDIVSMKSEKNGIILCKNFHMIHNELLEIFYSYMQQYNHPQLNIQIKFILMTEHISFLPNSVINNCRIISVKRPASDKYDNLLLCNNPVNTLDGILPSDILNIKEVHSFSLVRTDNTTNTTTANNQTNTTTANNQTNTTTSLPKELFNIVCDSIIQIMQHPKKIVITEFRDTIYDILVYNLDVADCVWYILTYFINVNRLSYKDTSDILDKTFTFFKYYNNNYRPIYHLENIFVFILNRLYGYRVI